MKNLIAERPWLLVIAAFLLVITVWLVAMRVSSRINTHELTPAQEMQLLKSKQQP